jgi:hypothetical protein
VIVATAIGGGEDYEGIPTVDDAIMRLEDALIADDEDPEVVDPERLALRRALNLPDLPASMSRRR